MARFGQVSTCVARYHSCPCSGEVCNLEAILTGGSENLMGFDRISWWFNGDSLGFNGGLMGLYDDLMISDDLINLWLIVT